MPELPEVETIHIGLSALLPGKRIVGVTHDWPKSFPNSEMDVQRFLVGATIKDIYRRAKVLIIDLDSKYSLIIHLKMTGQLVYVREARKLSANSSKLTAGERFGAGHPTDSLVGRLPDKSTRVIFTFQDGSKLFFNDQRKFGWVRLLPTVEIAELDFFKKVGPEPLADTFTADDFIARLMRRPKSGIKAVLLDQTVIAGVGNIYADESLWAAKIHPLMRVMDVPKAKLKTLYTELCRILRLSIEKGGSTDRNYVNHEGKRGSYLSFAQVFRREGQPCPRHLDTTILKIRAAGRGTHICVTCQELNKIDFSTIKC
jgi:formamidopyrimidine-DNA glycosylase